MSDTWVAVFDLIRSFVTSLLQIKFPGLSITIGQIIIAAIGLPLLVKAGYAIFGAHGAESSDKE